MTEKCKCQDSTGKACGREMTVEELKQDGMCWHCADNVWIEIMSNPDHQWRHSDRVDADYT